MQKNLFALATFLFLTVLLHAQNDAKPLKVKFGKISEEELKMTKYDKDPDAPAVILFDKGESNYESGVTRHVRIKIFNKSGYEFANHLIPYYKSSFVRGIKGVCYNLVNGKIEETKLEKENIFDESITKTLSLKKLTMPNVHEGSIVEFEYNIDGEILTEWTFQNEIPTIWSEFKMVMPDYYHFSKIGQGSTPYLVQKEESRSKVVGSGANVVSFSINESLWIQKDVPAFKPEKYITSSADYLTRLIFYLEEIRPPAGYGLTKRVIGTWKEEAKELLYDNDYFGFIDKKNTMKNELATVVNDGMKPREKVQAIFDYVGKNFEQRKGSSLFLTGSVKELKETRKITASEMNIIMMNMLRTAGIEVRPVMTSTRNHGKIGTTFAVYKRFDRVLGHIFLEKDTFFIDVASYPHPIDLLPFEDLNGGGYEFWGKDSYELVVPSNKMATRKMSQSLLSLNTEGELSGNISMTTTGYDAVEHRQKIKEMGAERFAQNTLKGLLVSGKLEDHKFDKADVFGENNLKGVFKVKTTDYVTIEGDKIYINPLLCFGEKENPFSNPQRFYTIDYGVPKEEISNLVLDIPTGYKIEELPKTIRFQYPEGAMKYDYLLEVSGNQIKLNTRLSIRRTSYLVEEYDSLRDFYSKIIAKMGEQIVLTKTAK